MKFKIGKFMNKRIISIEMTSTRKRNRGNLPFLA